MPVGSRNFGSFDVWNLSGSASPQRLTAPIVLDRNKKYFPVGGESTVPNLQFMALGGSLAIFEQVAAPRREAACQVERAEDA